MIKNFHSLTEEEYLQFKQFYIDYFKNHLVYYRAGVPRRLNSLLNKMWAREYVRVMLERIISGRRVCLVSLRLGNAERLPNDKYKLHGKVDGFIIGRNIDETKEAWISHFYVEDEHHLTRKQKSLDLCREFANIMKSMGMETIVTEAQMDDPKLVDTLESLNFQEKNISGDVTEYEKRI